MNDRVKQFLTFAGFLLVQAFLSRFVDLGPLLFIAIYPLFIITLPLGISINTILLWSFTTGICTDFFSGQIIGLNSASALIMSVFQTKILNMVYYKGDLESQVRPGMKELGMSKFSGYMLSLLAIHHVCYTLLESFGFRFFLENIPRLIVSFVINALLIYLIEYGIFYKFRK